LEQRFVPEHIQCSYVDDVTADKIKFRTQYCTNTEPDEQKPSTAP